MELLAPAKINLNLRVGPKRDDGFHPLASWMVTIGLFDSLHFQRVADAIGVTLVCEGSNLPNDDRNLIVRVGNAFARELAVSSPEGRSGIPGFGAEAVLHKRIALGAGLGGGSSNAACALMALNRLWNANWPTDRLREFAARFGSDVPFFFAAPSAVCRGRGEIVRPVAPPAVARWAVLLLPREAVSTADAYRRFDDLGLGSDPKTLESDAGIYHPDWTRRPALEFLPLLRNDLEPAAFDMLPQLGRLREHCEREVARPVRMSG